MSAPPSWSDSGYVTEMPYLRDYLRYQSPITMAFGAACNGFDFPDSTAPFRYCDLGCGEAVTTLTLAAAYPQGQFVGVDLNPEHIANATALAEAAGLDNLRFIAGDFTDPRIAAEGPFEFIAAHGVYSWVSPQVQGQMHDLVRDHLVPGGLFYFCHYVRPGAYEMEALFHLVQSRLSLTTGPLTDRLRQAVLDLRALQEMNAPFVTGADDFKANIKDLEERDLRYLVHEFGNQFFNPRFPSEVFADLAACGLHHAGATRLDTALIDNLFPDAAPAPLHELPHEAAQIQAGLASGESFRWDIFRKLKSGETTPEQTQDRLDGFLLDAAVFPYGFPKTATLFNRSATFDSPAFFALSHLCQEGQRRIGDLLADPSLAAFDPKDLRRIIKEMAGSSQFQPLVQPAREIRTPGTVKYRFCSPLAEPLCLRDVLVEGHVALPSELTGCALRLGRFDSLAAWAMHGRSRKEAAAFVEQQVRAFSPELVKRFRAIYFVKPEDFKTKWGAFERSTLPLLVKYAVLEPVTP